MSCSAYKPSSSTEDLAHIQSGTNSCYSGFMGAGGNPVRTYPNDCGFSVFVTKQPGPGFTGTKFENTLTWIQPHLRSVAQASAGETRNGYPTSSYVPLADAFPPLPPQFNLCNQ